MVASLPPSWWRGMPWDQGFEVPERLENCRAQGTQRVDLLLGLQPVNPLSSMSTPHPLHCLPFHVPASVLPLFHLSCHVEEHEAWWMGLYKHKHTLKHLGRPLGEGWRSSSIPPGYCGHGWGGGWVLMLPF